MSPDAAKPGEILRGKYRVERVLGAGGMGVVLLATHLRMHQLVAIKVLRSETRHRRDVVVRFAHEARAASRLRGDHAVRILDVDDSESGDPFLVMEYLEGTDLHRHLEATGALSVDVATDYMFQVCEGIAEAHASGIVHRDLKPSNLFLTKRTDGSPLIKILDFGISKTVGVEAPANELLTAPSAAIGSPAYMSPEQLKDAANVDVRTDIWSMGVVFYQLLMNALPFEAATTAALVARIVADPPRPLRPDVPQALAMVVGTCLEKEPHRRYADVAALARSLAPFARRGESGAERVARVAATTAQRANVDSASSAEPPLDALANRPETVSLVHGTASAEPIARSAIERALVSEYGSVAPGGGPTAPKRRRSIGWWAFVAAPGCVLVAAGIWFALHSPPRLSRPAGTTLPASGAPVPTGVCPTYVVAGDVHTCIRRSDGSLLCWGDNRFGQLGTGDTEKHGTPSRVDFGGLGTLKAYVPSGNGEIAADLTAFTCALASDDNFWCWGDNRFGQLGTGDTQSASKPVLVKGLNGRVAKATNGAGNTCVQTTEGVLYCWGRNLQGQLGTGDTHQHPSPVRIEISSPIERVAAGGDFTCARGTDARLYCWGANTRGQLGIGSTNSELRPVEVKALGRRVGRLVAGGAHACVFTEDDGQVWCWGDNRSGQLGTGDTERRLVPAEIDPQRLGRVKINQLFAGGNHTCALRDDNTLWCWGGNRYGQLGTGDTTPRLTPTQVLTNVSAAYAGGAHTCVIKTDGSVWCWGNNQYHQLGLDVGSQSLVPAQVLRPCQ